MKTKLVLTEQHYRYLFENASDAIWVHDMTGIIVDANKACKELTGYSREELIGMNIKVFLISEQSMDTARRVRKKLLKEEDIGQPYTQQLRRKDGTIRTMNMATSLVVIDGEIRGFQHVARDVTEEKRLRENMSFYIHQCTRAQEDERKRIARELHDEASPPLLLLIQRLDAITSNGRSRVSKPLRDKLEELRGHAVDALEGLRRCAQDLRPRIVDDLGLLPALEWMAENLTKDFGILAEVNVIGTARSLPDEVEVLLFRIAQEALSNIRRHAAASKARITIEFSDDKTVLIVEDNGKGFQLPQSMGDLTSIGKLGLAGIQERAQLIGGQLTLKSGLGRGTIVTVEVPT